MKSYWESTLKYQASDIHKFYVTRTWRTRTFENPCDRFFFGKVFIVMVIFIYEHLNSLLTSLCLFVFFNLYQGSWIIKNCRRGVVFALWRTALVILDWFQPRCEWKFWLGAFLVIALSGITACRCLEINHPTKTIHNHHHHHHHHHRHHLHHHCSAVFRAQLNMYNGAFYENI